MRALRAVFALLGLAAMVFGVLQFVDFALPFGPQTVSALGFLLGGPVLHDALVAPIVGVVGLLLSRIANPAWRTPLIVGAVLTAVLTLIAIPLLWRDYGAPPLPGLHDGDPGTGLLLSLAVVWVGCLGAGVVRQVRGRRPAVATD